MRDLSVRWRWSGPPPPTAAGFRSQSVLPSSELSGAQSFRTAPLLIVRDESHRLSLGGLVSTRARLRFTGCIQHARNRSCRSRIFQRTANCVLTVCLSPGGKRSCSRRCLPAIAFLYVPLLRKRARSVSSKTRATCSADGSASRRADQKVQHPRNRSGLMAISGFRGLRRAEGKLCVRVARD